MSFVSYSDKIIRLSVKKWGILWNQLINSLSSYWERLKIQYILLHFLNYVTQHFACFLVSKLTVSHFISVSYWNSTHLIGLSKFIFKPRAGVLTTKFFGITWSTPGLKRIIAQIKLLKQNEARKKLVVSNKTI